MKLLKTPLSPTTAKERHVILDALRGLALLGIALANFPEFALWTFLSLSLSLFRHLDGNLVILSVI